MAGTWQARRTGLSAANAVGILMLGVILALALIFLASTFWWSDHNCYT